MIDPSDSESKAVMLHLENNSLSAWHLIDTILGRLANTELDGAILNIQNRVPHT